MQANQNGVIWTVVIATILLLVAGAFFVPYVVKKNVPTVPDVPSADEIANAVLANVDVPTAEEIAALVDIPEASDTLYSVMDDKEDVAEELARDELNNNGFKSDLADYLSANDCDGDCSLDLQKKDIKSIEVIDVDFNGIGNAREVVFTTRVTVDDDGDEETVKVEIAMWVTDLVRNDDYEDAQVDDSTYNFDFMRCYNSFC